ncbi:hypothetical protein HYV49_06270 [Candidatus Pacearchaeota archaeon]|nr:hypothetical protein [Candidatus Pacearchaeota archaeon]
MVQYRCMSCKYRMETEKKPKRCPWCDADDSLREEQSADDLLRELQ